MNIGVIQTIWTIVVMVIFVGIVFWAWSDKRKKSFDESSQIPLEDDKLISSEMPSKENNHV